MTTSPTVAIIDAYSLLYRAFFALPTSLTNKQGEVTNAAYGFTTMLLKLLDEVKPDYLVVATDLPTATFRHLAFEEYKAHRKPMPDEMRPQVPMVGEILEAMGIPILGVSGFEADDVIGTLACRAAAEGMRALIVTGDRDALQLVNDQVHVLATKRGITDTVEYDPAGVLERYGVTPAQLPDMKALMGDASDNIPGVPGIGEKTASKLIAQYGDLETLLAHVDEVKGKIGAALATYVDQARQSRELATIHLQVPLDDFTWECCHRRPWDDARLLELFVRLNFRSLLPRLGASAVATEAAPTPQEITIQPVAILEDPAAVTRAVTAIRAHGTCALIPVGDGEDPLRATLVGMALSAGPDIHIYIPLQTTGALQGSLFADLEPTPASPLKDALAPLLADPAVHKTAYDLKTTRLWVEQADLILAGGAFDALLAGYLIDPTAKHGITDLALDHLSVHREIASPLSAWQTGDRQATATAASEQAQLLAVLEAPLRAALADLGLMPLYRDVELPLASLLATMEARGIAVDTRQLDELSLDLGKSIHQLEGAIYDLAGETFTINSPKQLQTILFDKLNLPRGRKLKTGYSTDADTLAGLAEQHEIVAKLLQYRELTKLKSTYVDSLPRLVNPRTGHVHTHFNQAVTATGRLSSSDPNLQNIPIRTSEGRAIRRAFIPSTQGWLLLAADYSQIELRVLAHFSKDPALIEVFQRGEDLHTAAACRLFGVSPDAVTREMRRVAKVVNFSIPYGTSAFGLAGQIGRSPKEAEELMTTYLARFPGVKTYMDDVVACAKHDGYVTTLLNRRRPIPDLNASNYSVRQAAERVAINTPIQGSAADIMKLAMLHVAAACDAHPDLHGRLLLQVHDEVVFETPPEEVGALAALVKRAMVQAYPDLLVPLEVEVKVGPNWCDVSPQA
jgi:DNA polymerase-1